MLEPYRSVDYMVVIKLKKVMGRELIYLLKKEKENKNDDNLTTPETKSMTMSLNIWCVASDI